MVWLKFKLILVDTELKKGKLVDSHFHPIRILAIDILHGLDSLRDGLATPNQDAINVECERKVAACYC